MIGELANLAAFERINFDALYPPFARLLELLVDNCRARRAHYIATSGLRTYDEQATIYAKGRTVPGGVVTKARPGQSPHNFAIAVDFARDAAPETPKLQPDYSTSAYVVLAEEAKQIGLDAGYWWKPWSDAPHVQLPVKARGLRWSHLDAAYKAGGYPRVFALLDTKGPW